MPMLQEIDYGTRAIRIEYHIARRSIGRTRNTVHVVDSRRCQRNAKP